MRQAPANPAWRLKEAEEVAWRLKEAEEAARRNKLRQPMFKKRVAAKAEGAPAKVSLAAGLKDVMGGDVIAMAPPVAAQTSEGGDNADEKGFDDFEDEGDEEVTSGLAALPLPSSIAALPGAGMPSTSEEEFDFDF